MTLYELAQKCENEIRLVGTLTEFNIESYEKNGVIVVKYKGVVKCDNAFISIKSSFTNYDSTIKEFVNQFYGKDQIGHKVYIIGKLNSIGGITTNYISLANDSQQDCFKGRLIGVMLNNNSVLIVNNESHQLLSFVSPCATNSNKCFLGQGNLTINPLIVQDNVIIDSGNPSITLENGLDYICPIDKEIVEQAIEEHNIYLEAMRG